MSIGLYIACNHCKIYIHAGKTDAGIGFCFGTEPSDKANKVKIETFIDDHISCSGGDRNAITISMIEDIPEEYKYLDLDFIPWGEVEDHRLDALEETNIIRKPLNALKTLSDNEELIYNLIKFQTCGLIHPMTCGGGGGSCSGVELEPVVLNDKVVMECPECHRVQKDIGMATEGFSLIDDLLKYSPIHQEIYRINRKHD